MSGRGEEREDPEAREEKMCIKAVNYTYIIECSDGTYYTGWTNHLEKRIEAHNRQRGAKYTKNRIPVHLVYYEMFETKQEAMRREYEIKQMKRKQKEEMIKNFRLRNLSPFVSMRQ